MIRWLSIFAKQSIHETLTVSDSKNQKFKPIIEWLVFTECIVNFGCVVFFLSAIRTVILLISYGSPIAFCLLRVVYCEGRFLPRNGGKKTPLQVQDRLRDGPHWFPGFLDCCSWMFPEQLRNKSELAGSRGTHQVLTRLPRSLTLFG